MASSPALSEVSTLVDSPRSRTSSETVAPLQINKKKIISEDASFREKDILESLDKRRQDAIAFQDRSQFEKARWRYESIQKSCEESWGSRDPRTLMAKEDVAVNLAHLGQYKESQELFEQILEEHQVRWEQNRPGFFGFRRQTHEELHLAVARSYHNVANIMTDQNSVTEASLNYRQAFSIRRKYLGSSHHDSLSSLTGLAGCYISLRQFNRAEKLIKQADEGYRRLARGADEPHTYADSFFPDSKTLQVYILSVCQSQAIIHDLRGKPGETARAEELFLFVWDRIQEYRAPDHRDVIEAAANIGAYYDRHSKLDDAEDFYSRAVDRCDVLGSSHPLSVSLKQRLSNVRERSRACWPPREHRDARDSELKD